MPQYLPYKLCTSYYKRSVNYIYTYYHRLRLCAGRRDCDLKNFTPSWQVRWFFFSSSSAFFRCSSAFFFASSSCRILFLMADPPGISPVDSS